MTHLQTHRRGMLPGFVLALALGANAACGPLSYTVNNSVFQDLAADKQMRLFDAENDVSLAQDEKTQMQEVVRSIQSDIDQSKSALRKSGGEDGKNAATARMYAARIKYLAMSKDYMLARADAQDTSITASQAKFELAKALIVKKNKMSGADKIVIRDFEKQAEVWATRKKDVLAELDRKKLALIKGRLAWLKQRDEVAASNLGSVLLPGDEEQPAWQNW